MKNISHKLLKHVEVPPHFYPEDKKPNIFVRTFHLIIRLFKDKTSAAFIFSCIGVIGASYALLAPPKVIQIETKVPVYLENPEIKKVDIVATGEVVMDAESLKIDLTITNDGKGGTSINKIYFKDINQNILREPIAINPHSTQKITLSAKEAAIILKNIPLMMSLANGETKDLSGLLSIPEEVRSQMHSFVTANKEKIIWELIEDTTMDLNKMSESDAKLFFSSMDVICQDLTALKDNFKDKLSYSRFKKNVDLQKFYGEMIHVVNGRIAQCGQLNAMIIADILNWQKNDRDNYTNRLKLPQKPFIIIHKQIEHTVDPQRELAYLDDVFSNIKLLWKNRDNRTFVHLFNRSLKKN